MHLQQPFIPSKKCLPEITLKAIILSLILTIILSAANAYLALKMGLTLSASIPAAVISMGLLRLFKHSNILENNIVQTAASSGEALVAGVSFVIPSLIILKFWYHFHYWETVTIALFGGIFGVLFSTPLRQVLLHDPELRFPEGTAIGKVLIASDDKSHSPKYLVIGSLVGSTISLFQNGFRLVSTHIDLWTKPFNTVMGTTIGFEPAMIAAGYIIGVETAIAMLSGLVLGWTIGIPLIIGWYDFSVQNSAQATAMSIWSDYLRYIGVGSIVTGGLWTLFYIIKPVITRIMHAVFHVAKPHKNSIPRTERDISLNLILCLIVLILIPLYILFSQFTIDTTIIVTATVFCLVIGFIIALICSYITGLVGSTNNPISGMSIASLMFISLLLVALDNSHGHDQLTHMAIAIVATAIIAGAGAIGGDTIQDLKAGQLVGATPWKQQVMLIFGSAIAAFTIPWILELLFNAYGIAGIFPREGMDPNKMLVAPHASAITAVVQGAFSNHLPWNMIGLGGILAVLGIIADGILKKYSGKRFPVLAIGLGVYLPPTITTPLIIGGAVKYFATHCHKASEKQHQQALLLACGIVSGAAIMGILLAVPIAISQSTDVLCLRPQNFAPYANLLGILSLVCVCYWLFNTTLKRGQ